MLLIVAPVMTLVTPQAVMAGDACERRILLIPPWYRDLTDDDCNIVSPSSVPGGLGGFIWRVALNVVEIGLFIAGYVSLLFIFYGGFLFLTGGSNPTQTEKARKTLVNAVIGLIISIASIAIVNLIFGLVKG